MCKHRINDISDMEITNTINMANLLVLIGARESYIEMNKHNHLEYKGVTYYYIDADINNINSINYNFTINDTDD
ncbi:hypothetical protein PV797_10560 [Clostridiaceae bacterium M8S5]|nr:hypothetical protein PV797_10560 [Clostridiaceae bacterium M8S5]